MWSILDRATIDEIVGAALQSGVTWFDTAQAYGNGQSERALGSALRDLGVRHGDVVVATKWIPGSRPPATSRAPSTCDSPV